MPDLQNRADDADLLDIDEATVVDSAAHQ